MARHLWLKRHSPTPTSRLVVPTTFHISTFGREQRKGTFTKTHNLSEAEDGLAEKSGSFGGEVECVEALELLP